MRTLRSAFCRSGDLFRAVSAASRHGAVLALGMLGAGGPGAVAQCQQVWTPAPAGLDFNGPVRAMTVFGSLYAGGEFTEAGGQPANHVARRVFTGWAALGSGTNGNVLALARLGSHIYVGGEFATAGGLATGGLARWNTSTLAWEPGATPPFAGAVVDLEAAGAVLYAVVRLPGLPMVTNVLRRTGEVWEPVGATIPWIGRALVVDGTGLFLGGWLAGVPETTAITARWNGAAWQNAVVPANCCGSKVLSMASFEGAPVLTGSNTPPMRWDGAQWADIGTGHPGGDVIGVFEDQLIASTGPFSPALLAWDGAAWSPLGTGGPNGPVSALLPLGATLMVGGVPYTSPNRYWARYHCICYPDCNNSFALTAADWACFQNRFVLGDMYADCNNSGTLSIADFGCYRTAFVNGCP